MQVINRIFCKLLFLLLFLCLSKNLSVHTLLSYALIALLSINSYYNFQILFLHFKNGYINHILGNYHASVESIQDMDAQYREKALSEIQNRLLDDNSSIHTDSPALSADSGKPALSLSSADQTWFELSSDCSDEEKEQMIKAAAFIKSCLRHSDK